jgi:hypothetical protein
MTDEKRAAIIEAYKKYGNVKDTALFMSTAVPTVRDVVREAGLLKRQGAQPVTLPPREELRALFERFRTRKAVAYVLGINDGTLKRHLENNLRGAR